MKKNEKPKSPSNSTVFQDYLKSHMIFKDAVNPPEITNTRIGDKDSGIFGGKYHIPQEEYPQFLEHYYRFIFKEKHNKEYLTEKQLETGGPILIDIDLHFKFDVKKRLYTQEHIIDLIQHAYLEELKKIYQFDDESVFSIYIFEKETVNPVAEKQITKDGIHIILGINTEHRQVQLYLRDRVIDRVKDMWSDLPITNNWKEVFDDGITQGGTNWQLFGSQKPNHEPYKLTQTLEITFNEEGDFILKKTDFTITEKTIGQLSARCATHPTFFYKSGFMTNYLSKILESGESNGLGGTTSKRNNVSRKTQKMNTHSPILNALFNDVNSTEELDKLMAEFLESLGNSEYELKESYYYTMSLPEDYYVSGSYNKRMRVGWALRNIDDRLLIVWIKFLSQRTDFSYPMSIQEGYEEWSKFDMGRADGLTKKSIMHWSKMETERLKLRKEDDKNFYKIRGDSITHYIQRVLLQPNCGDTDKAQLLYQLYKEQYVCASIKANIWYEYKNQRWTEVEAGTTLRYNISDGKNGLLAIFEKLWNKIHNEEIKKIEDGKMPADDPSREKTKKDLGKISDIMKSLGQTACKNNVMTEAREQFYDGLFLNKLDINPYLLCFNNGVIDFKDSTENGKMKALFREGRPEDCITKSTKLDYLTDFDENREKYQSIVNEINDFMRKLFPEPELETYMWEHLASTLIGVSMNQTFNMYTGKGQNGKSVLMTLMSLALGDYKVDVPLTIITEKRTKPGGLNPEVVALKGSRYAVMAESSKGDRINEGVMKQYTGGTDVIQCRAPYMTQMLCFMPQFKLVICSNELMEIKATDHGTWRRIRVVPFMSLFTNDPVQNDPAKPYQYKIDLKIDEKFGLWKEVFLRMLVNKVRETGGIVNDCEQVLVSSKQYKEGQDMIAQFIKEKIIYVKKGKIEKRQVRQAFDKWFTDLYGDRVNYKILDVYSYFDKTFGQIDVKGFWRGISISMIETSDDGGSDNGDDEDDTEFVNEFVKS